MTIIVEVDEAFEQVTKQPNKLVSVLKIVELDPEEKVERRLILLKVRADETRRTGVFTSGRPVPSPRGRCADRNGRYQMAPFPSWKPLAFT